MGKLFKPPCVYVCCMYANLKPLCIYAELYLCPCTCPLHPLPEASSNCHGCQAKRGEKKQGCRGAYPGRTQRQKPSQPLPCGAVLTIRGAFSSSDQEGRPSGFRGPFLRVTGFHPDIVCLWTLTLALEIPAFKSQQ